MNEQTAPSFLFRNDSGEEVPAFGILRITGTDSEGPGKQFLKADKPDTYGSQYLHYVNGPVAVADGGFGRCFLPTAPVMASYNDAATPAFGESWGPTDDSWKLKQYVGGFQVVGGHASGRVMVVQAPMLTIFGKTDAAHDKGDSGTVSVWHGDLDSETDSAENITALNRFADVESGKEVECVWKFDGWVLISAEC